MTFFGEGGVDVLSEAARVVVGSEIRDVLWYNCKGFGCIISVGHFVLIRDLFVVYIWFPFDCPSYIFLYLTRTTEIL